jgi:hypothetical protein
LTGRFGPDGATGQPVAVDGFCDSDDGKLHRIRFMPTRPGRHRYDITLRHVKSGDTVTNSGGLTATAGRTKRRGLVRVDKVHPFHFVWEGTGEHYFWNGTTTYWLLGWHDKEMLESVDRLHRLKVNYLRVALNGRVANGKAWFEDVYPSEKFSFLLNPWVAQRPDSVDNPGFDVSRFNLAHWQKVERLLRYARDKDMVVSLFWYVDGARQGTDPFGKQNAGNDDEKRYYRYGVARFAAFSNVMWDVTNEYHLFRDEAWTNRMGAYIKERDPYDHLTSVHGHGQFPFRTEKWADFAMYQAWDEGGGYGFMRHNREEQKKTGRPMPQVNEEYGYEDHYPQGWGDNKKAPARSADNRRRLAWGMYMAGGYQTTGERATAVGGWINGRGDASMTMLVGYGHIRRFFESLEWWKTDPRPDLVEGSGGPLCLAEPGRQYVLYLPAGSSAVRLKLEPGRYKARWYNPRTGRFSALPDAEGPQWAVPNPPDKEDWAVLLTR